MITRWSWFIFGILCGSVLLICVRLATGQTMCLDQGTTVLCTVPPGETTMQHRLSPTLGIVVAPDGTSTPYTVIAPPVHPIAPPVVLDPATPLLLPAPSPTEGLAPIMPLIMEGERSLP